MRISDLTKLYFAKQTTIDNYGEETPAYSNPIFVIYVLKAPLTQKYEFALYGTDIDTTFRLFDDTETLSQLSGVYGIWENEPKANEDGYYDNPDYITVTPVRKVGKYCTVDVRGLKMR